MAIKLNSEYFIHIPKTGGTSRTASLIMEGGEAVGSQHTIPADIRFGYAFVRHPVSWYRSWWSWRTYKGWPEAQVTGIPDTLSALVSATIHARNLPFPKFVDVITDTKPGLYDHFLYFYEVPRVKILRLEDQDMQFALNVSRAKPEMTEDIARKIELSEKNVMERYNYKPWSDYASGSNGKTSND